MTNKSLFVTIFIITIIGLLGGINILYQHLNSTTVPQEHSVNQLNQKLLAAESQIKLIVSENNVLRMEVKRLKQSINELALKLNGLGTITAEESLVNNDNTLG
jgi:regulator of replication initiation timing